jgi:secreted PhoX family phosphatase
MSSNPSSRRRFLSDSFSTASAFAVGAAFQSLGSRLSHARPIDVKSKVDLVPCCDETTGVPLLKLPAGFRYVTFGWTDDPLTNGDKTPGSHDGMAVIASDGDLVTVARNHEVNGIGSPMPSEHGSYDPVGKGGCTNLVFDTKAGKLKKSWVSLSGTVRNCAGGPTPWGTWLTCEETLVDPKDWEDPKAKVKKLRKKPYQKSHGWIFEVPATGKATNEPLVDMGRFIHEAIAIDRKTGIVYETEDRRTSGFYRFLPKTPGKMAAGGKLQMMKVIGEKDLRRGVDHGSTFDVEWVDIAEPQRAHRPKSFDNLGCFSQGKALGGTTFARLEGCWASDDGIFFDATSGGARGAGQIWKFDPAAQKLSLIFESPGKEVLNMPDNLCVHPDGGIILCEDGDYGNHDSYQRIHTLTQDGNLKPFAMNNVILKGEHNKFKGDFRKKEFAGATFSPDGKWLFVNAQTPGITFAITGPWADRIS